MDPLHRQRVEACRCLKQDIPEVEAVIAALVPRLETWWVQAIEDALRQGDLLLGIEELTSAPLPQVEALAGRTIDGRSRPEIEAELVAILERRLRDQVTAFVPRLAQRVEEARDTLLLDAALALGLSLTVEQLVALERRLGPLRAAAVADLQTLMVGRLDTRRPEIRAALERLARARVRSATGISGPRPAAAGAVAAQTLREELRALLGAASPRQWIPFVADQWSYRWFNIGQFLAARDAGFTLFRAVNNPPRGPDIKTTPFCRSIHLRLVDVAGAENQIRRHVRQSLGGNVQGLMQNWPLLDPDLVQDDGPAAEARHLLAFRRVGLPPYHARCRTVVQPVRLQR